MSAQARAAAAGRRELPINAVDRDSDRGPHSLGSAVVTQRNEHLDCQLFFYCRIWPGANSHMILGSYCLYRLISQLVKRTNQYSSVWGHDSRMKLINCS